MLQVTCQRELDSATERAFDSYGFENPTLSQVALSLSKWQIRLGATFAVMVQLRPVVKPLLLFFVWVTVGGF